MVCLEVGRLGRVCHRNRPQVNFITQFLAKIPELERGALGDDKGETMN